MEIINNVLPYLPIFFSIILLESILSIDNASVLAVIVNKNLQDPSERSKAFKYGMIGAYVFRGLSLLLVSYILNYPSYGNIFMILGGLYLVYLFYSHLTPTVEDNVETMWERVLNKYLKINIFWKTVIMVEIIDLIFSLDNLVAVVGMSQNIWVVVIGVFVGIAVMRFVAVTFSKLLAKYPQLENSAFIVILLIGIKLVFSGITGLATSSEIGINLAKSTGTINFFLYSREILSRHSTDLIFSSIMLVVFAIPFITTGLRNLFYSTMDKMPDDPAIENDGTGYYPLTQKDIMQREVKSVQHAAAKRYVDKSTLVEPVKVEKKKPQKKQAPTKENIVINTEVSEKPAPHRKRRHNRKKKSTEVES